MRHGCHDVDQRRPPQPSCLDPFLRSATIRPTANGHLLARFDWGSGAVCFGASPVAAVFGSAPGSATSPKHRLYSIPCPPPVPSKQDISTLPGIGHFYFALTRRSRRSRREWRTSVGSAAPGRRIISGSSRITWCKREALQMDLWAKSVLEHLAGKPRGERIDASEFSVSPQK